MKVALVHEHLAQDGGAERVARVFQAMYPEAPLFTLVYNRERAHPSFRGTDIRTSFIQRLPGGVRFFPWYLPLMPTAVELFDLRGFDVVISSASAFAKGVITDPQTLHLCYLHSPTRYLWSDSLQYVKDLPYPKVMKAIISRHLTNLRQWDRMAADRVDDYVVNSQLVNHRLQKYYRRHGTVIHPPIDVDRFTVGRTTKNYYVTGGRLAFYKRFDLAVQAFNHLKIPLKIFGTGPALKSLQAMAHTNIEFVGRVPDADLNALYSQAVAFINPQEEDFGITVVEAMAAGRPVIAYAAGGALETVKPGVTGVLFPDQDWEALADTVVRFKPEQYQPAAIRAWAETFGIDRFKASLQAHVERAYHQHVNHLDSLT